MTFSEWFSSTPRGYNPTLIEAWNAGYTAFANELCEKCGQTRQHAGGGCIHCITEWCKDKVREAQAERDEVLEALVDLTSTVGLALDGATGWDAHKNARAVIAKMRKQC